MRQDERSASFTLLEILVVLVVLGFLLVGLMQGVRFGVLAWDTQARTIARSGDIDAIDRTIRRMITELDPGLTDDPPTVTGDAHGLQMKTVLPEGASGLVTRDADVSLRVDQAHRLVLRWVPSPHAERLTKAAAGSETVLMAGVDHLDIAYCRTDPKASGWVASWSDPNPPQLIRVHIVFPRGDPRRWPDIVAGPFRMRIDE
jgi:general secretion pathway protein J